MTIGRARTVRGIPTGVGAPAITQTEGDLLMGRILSSHEPALSWIIDPRKYVSDAAAGLTLRGGVRGAGVQFKSASSISVSASVTAMAGQPVFWTAGGSVKMGARLAMPAPSFSLVGTAMIAASWYSAPHAMRILSVLDQQNSEIFNLSIGSSTIYAGNTTGQATRPLSGNVTSGHRFSYAITYGYTAKETKLYINSEDNVGTAVASDTIQYATDKNRLYVAGTGPIFSTTGHEGAIGKIYGLKSVLSASQVAAAFVALATDYGDL